MPSLVGGPRTLLRRLREVMAEPISMQTRLDKMVVIIAANIAAEACSLYVMRADGDLVLYAAEGIDRDAVGGAIVPSGLGLIGFVASTAEPLALSDAQNHAHYRPALYVDDRHYKSFLGVPLLRAGAIFGVLAVQNRNHREYTEDEIEALQTTAMVLTELVANAPGITSAQGEGLRRPAMRRTGIGLHPGIALGEAALHQPRVVVKNLIAEDVSKEWASLDKAITVLHERVETWVKRRDLTRHPEAKAIINEYLFFVRDAAWLDRMREATSSGLTAEAAVERVASDFRARFLRKDATIQMRDFGQLEEFEDLTYRLIRELTQSRRPRLSRNAILVASSMPPVALLDYDRARLRGLVLESEAPQPRLAAMGHALGIPVIVQVNNATTLIDVGDVVILDGESGEVRIRPPLDVQMSYLRRAQPQGAPGLQRDAQENGSTGVEDQTEAVHRPKRTNLRRKPGVPRLSLPKLEVSREKLVLIKELLDGYAGSDEDPTAIGNRLQVPLSSNTLETIKSILEAGIRIHDAPIVTEHSISILERVRRVLIDLNKTLDVLNGTLSRGTKLFWNLSKFGLAAAPAAALLAATLSPAVKTVTCSP